MFCKATYYNTNYVYILKYILINLFINFRNNILSVFNIINNVNKFFYYILLKFFNLKLNKNMSFSI